MSLSSIFAPRIRFVDKLLFTKHLSVMLRSGIPLSESITVLEDQTRNSSFKKILNSLSASIQNGASLEKSLSAFPGVFDTLYRSIIHIGEQSGTLETNLDYLASQLSKNYEFRKKVQSALLYPSLVLFTGAGVGSFVSLFVLPQLVDLFASLGTDLPASTRFLLFFAGIMKSYGVLIIPSFFGLVFLFGVFIRLPVIRPAWHRFLLSLPLFGIFFTNVQIAGFTRNLGLMLKSGIPIAPALHSCALSADNLVFRGYIFNLEKAVTHGKSISEELKSKSYKHVPFIVSRLFGVGERSGKLDETLLYLADFFEEEVDDMTKNLSTLIEPLLLFLIAGMVLFLAFSIISPIYNFTGSVKK